MRPGWTAKSDTGCSAFLHNPRSDALDSVMYTAEATPSSGSYINGDSLLCMHVRCAYVCSYRKQRRQSLCFCGNIVANLNHRGALLYIVQAPVVIHGLRQRHNDVVNAADDTYGRRFLVIKMCKKEVADGVVFLCVWSSFGCWHFFAGSGRANLC